MKFIKNIFNKNENSQNNVSGEGLIDGGDSYLVCLCDKKGKVVSIASYSWYDKQNGAIILPINRFADNKVASECIDCIKGVIFNKIKDNKEREGISKLTREKFDVGLLSMYFIMYDDAIANIDKGEYSLKVILFDKDFNNKEGVNIKDLYIGQGSIVIDKSGINIIVSSVKDFEPWLRRKLTMIGQDLSGLEYCIALWTKGDSSIFSFLCESIVTVYKDGSAGLKIKKFKTHKDASDCAEILERDVLYNSDSNKKIANDVERLVKDQYGSYSGSLYLTISDESENIIPNQGYDLVTMTINKDGNLVVTEQDGTRGSINLDEIYIGDGKLSENKSSIIVDAGNVPGGGDAMKVFEKMKAEDSELAGNSHIEILL